MRESCYQPIESYQPIEALWKIKAIHIDFTNPFTLSSGKKSPIYIDCRRIISFPETRNLIIQKSLDILKKLNVEVVAGCETAGIPFASWLAYLAELPMIYVRKTPKEYGKMSQVEGFLEPGRKVLLCDDLITDGKGKLKFVNAIRDEGGKVEHCMVVFDREQGGEELLSSNGVKLHSIVRMKDCLEYGIKHGFIEREEAERVKNFL
jgi:orotate phosphoribosyltransferase